MLELEECVSTTDEAIPADLETMSPGPVLAAFLASVDVREISGYDRIVVLRAHQRMISHYTDSLYDDMAAVVDVLEDDGDGLEWSAAESAAAEIRAALTLTRRSADIELSIALDLQTRLPRVAVMLADGDLDLRRARVMLDDTGHLSDDAARTVIDQVADEAVRLTTGQLRARLRRLCIEVDTDDAARRYGEAVADRRVVMEPVDTGTANLLGMDLPPDRVTVATRRINRIARSLRRDGETRTMDQIRADIYLDLLCGAAYGVGDSGVVDIRVDLDTLVELNERPGDLAGYGPVIADIARNVAKQGADAEWRYTVTDPATGQAILTDITTRRPTAAQRRAVETRNPTCVFPGCRMPATDCDLDHRIPWSNGGPTTVEQLAPLCRHDHITVRHNAGWTYIRLPNGDYQWTSKLGHTYTTSGTPP